MNTIITPEAASRFRCAAGSNIPSLDARPTLQTGVSPLPDEHAWSHSDSRLKSTKLAADAHLSSSIYTHMATATAACCEPRA